MPAGRLTIAVVTAGLLGGCLFQDPHLAVADLDLREFAFDGSSYRVRKLFIQHDFLIYFLHVVLCRLDWEIIEASSPGIFCFSPSNHRLAAPSVVPVSSGSPPWALTRGLKTSGNLVTLRRTLDK